MSVSIEPESVMLTLARAVGEVIMEGPWWEYGLCTPAAQEIYYKGDGHQALHNFGFLLLFFFSFISYFSLSFGFVLIGFERFQSLQ